MTRTRVVDPLQDGECSLGAIGGAPFAGAPHAHQSLTVGKASEVRLAADRSVHEIAGERLYVDIGALNVDLVDVAVDEWFRF